MNKAVFGLGFGDEGKGLVTNYLALQNPEAVVCRFSGGQQAGHTVVKDDVRHVFSNFGSGSLAGNITYWTRYCTVDPIGIYNELQVLNSKGYNPTLYIDPNCPVTTPLDKAFNQYSDRLNGTVGVGVGTTWQREEDHFSLRVSDLMQPTIMNIKLKLIADYYKESEYNFTDFIQYVDYLKNRNNIHFSHYFNYEIPRIFEGSQGLLLDQHNGFFPHVTRSNTGTNNILELGWAFETYAVTRAYQTRHGNGPMTNEDIPHNIKVNPLETNIENEYQGKFRRSLLDLDLLEYAINNDYFLSTNRNNLVITCLDHIQDDLRLTYKGKIYQYKTSDHFIEAIQAHLMFDTVYISESDKSENIRKVMF